MPISVNKDFVNLVDLKPKINQKKQLNSQKNTRIPGKAPLIKNCHPIHKFARKIIILKRFLVTK